MSAARRFIADEGHARPGAGLFMTMLFIAAVLVVIGIVAGCMIGASA